MPYLRPPNCPYCRNHPLMSRKGFYKRSPPEPLYGLVHHQRRGKLLKADRQLRCASSSATPVAYLLSSLRIKSATQG